MDEALAKAQFLHQALEEKGRYAIERAWAHNLRSIEIWETVNLKDQLWAMENTIENLK